ARSVLGVRDRVHLARTRRRPGRGAPPCRLPPEHGDRRRGRRRPADREEADAASGVRDQPRRVRRRGAEGAPRRPRVRRPARRHLASAGDRPALRRRARDLRVLERDARGDALAHARAEGLRRAGRHRPAPLRARRARHRNSHGRGDPDAGPAARAALALLEAPEADDGRRARARRARRLRAAHAADRARDQARLARPRVLPAGAHGRPQRGVPHRQVPLDDGRRRRAQGRGRPSEQAPRGGRRPADVQDRRRPAAADPRRGPPRARLGAAPAHAQAGHHRPVAGARPRRHPVLGDDAARLPLRDELVALERPEADHADAAADRPVAGSRVAPRWWGAEPAARPAPPAAASPADGVFPGIPFATLAGMEPSREAVLAALSKVIDPELQKPVTELDMVRDVAIEDGIVSLTIVLTIAGCPLRDSFERQVEAAFAGVAGVRGFALSFGVMTPEERQALTTKLRGGAGRRDSTIRLPSDCRIIAVASGKGGVGKSTLTANLAVAFSQLGRRTGVIDADIYGHSIPHLLGIHQTPVAVDDLIVPPVKDGLKLMSIGFFQEENAPLMWRGPMLHRAFEQFLSDVHWGDLDVLVVDMPPGTGDVSISLAQLLPRAEVVVVTTPQKLAQDVAS